MQTSLGPRAWPSHAALVRKHAAADEDFTAASWIGLAGRRNESGRQRGVDGGSVRASASKWRKPRLWSRRRPSRARLELWDGKRCEKIASGGKWGIVVCSRKTKRKFRTRRFDTPHVPKNLLRIRVLCSVRRQYRRPERSAILARLRHQRRNQGYKDVVGNSQMPYFNTLIQRYGLATQFYSDQHGSLSALMWFVAGAAVTTNEATTSCQHSQDNVVRELLKRGYSLRAYEEDLPYAGYEGLMGGTGNWRHDPLLDFTDVCPSTGQNMNVVPSGQMAKDFADSKTVNFAWITPDVMDDAHNGSLQAADQWLQDRVPAILARPEFSSGGDGILFIVWDESDLYSDNACSATVSTGCGGHTAILVIGPRVKPDYKSKITYHNENVLATVCAAMGLSPCPGTSVGYSVK